MSETLPPSNRPRIRTTPAPRITKSGLTRAAIMDAALAFLWTKPFRDMTVNALMATLPVGRSAFYQYFHDVHELMETLLGDLGREILEFITPWLEGAGDPVDLLEQSLAGLVRICHRQGPFLHALSDAAPMDERLEKAWVDFLGHFDDVVTARLEMDQELGLIAPFDARPMAVALNRTNAYTLIQAFGQHPRGEPEPVLSALKRIWITTLYGSVSMQATSRIRQGPAPVPFTVQPVDAAPDPKT